MGAEEEEVAKMGCPSLGEHTQVEVVIEESYEFKVSVFVHVLYLHSHECAYKKLLRMNQQLISSILRLDEIMITRLAARELS